MAFEISWSLPSGKRQQILCASAKSAIAEIAARRLWRAANLRIRENEGVPLTLDALTILAGQ
ncbi:MAG: hypothetical protein AB7F22_31015 [Reyranella sp.]|uniref:hypothetical protein n=1 Tax=Reyranella sp. TaxID=1929291 RepID=UPI003D0CA9F8